MSGIKRGLKKALREMKYFSPLPKTARYFILICQERTGSTLFSDLLSFHDDILMDRHHFYTPETWPSSYQDGHIIFSRKPVRGYKFKVTHAPRKTPVEKTKAQLNTLSQNASIIRLKRQNKLRQALSAINHHTPLHQWKDDKQSTQGENGAPVINVDRLLESIHYYDRLTAFEDEVLKDVPHHEVIYERDLLPQDQHQATATSAFEHLGLAPARVETRLKKISKSDLRDYIGNFDEVYEAIKGTKFVQFLDQPEPTRSQ
jgi:LPS sulfotransferase NodH